jgi:hypothetical protein
MQLIVMFLLNVRDVGGLRYVVMGSEAMYGLMLLVGYAFRSRLNMG